MSDQKLQLGYSHLTERIYLGKKNVGGERWSGEKRDVTNEFIEIMLKKFDPNTTHTISLDGKPSLRVLVVDIDRVVMVDGIEVRGE